MTDPINLNAVRALATRDASKWTAEDALHYALKRVEEGKHKYAIVLLADDDGMEHVVAGIEHVHLTAYIIQKFLLALVMENQGN